MGKSSWKWNEFNKVHNNNDLEGYLYNREFEHSNYYHYTTAKAVDSILSGNSFWVSNVSGFNDTIDKKQFGNEEKFCFFYALAQEQVRTCPYGICIPVLMEKAHASVFLKVLFSAWCKKARSNCASSMIIKPSLPALHQSLLIVRKIWCAHFVMYCIIIK